MTTLVPNLLDRVNTPGDIDSILDLGKEYVKSYNQFHVIKTSFNRINIFKLTNIKNFIFHNLYDSEIIDKLTNKRYEKVRTGFHLDEVRSLLEELDDKGILILIKYFQGQELTKDDEGVLSRSKTWNNFKNYKVFQTNFLQNFFLSSLTKDNIRKFFEIENFISHFTKYNYFISNYNKYIDHVYHHLYQAFQSKLNDLTFRGVYIDKIFFILQIIYLFITSLLYYLNEIKKFLGDLIQNILRYINNCLPKNNHLLNILLATIQSFLIISIITKDFVQDAILDVTEILTTIILYAINSHNEFLSWKKHNNLYDILDAKILDETNCLYMIHQINQEDKMLDSLAYNLIILYNFGNKNKALEGESELFKISDKIQYCKAVIQSCNLIIKKLAFHHIDLLKSILCNIDLKQYQKLFTNKMQWLDYSDHNQTNSCTFIK
jgi:hypothetical protein